MEAHPDEVIAEGAGVHTVVEALEPATGLRIVVNLVFGSTASSLGAPMLEEDVRVENVIVFLRPIPERLTAGAVNGAQTAQLPELLRELRDFR